MSDSIAVEKHYRVKEIAALWGLSRTTVSALFRNEAGVIRLGEQRVSLSVPEGVLRRVHERLGAKPAQTDASAVRYVLRPMGKRERRIIKLKRVT